MNITSSNGKAIVTLHAEIGAIGAPKSPKTPLKYRSPAYTQRIARRQAMRQTVDENHSVEAGEASTEFGTVNVNEAVKPAMVDVAAETPSETNGFSIAEQACTSSNGGRVDAEEVDEDELERDKLVSDVVVWAVPPSDVRKPM